MSGDFLSGFNRTKARRRPARPVRETPRRISDTPHAWKCPHKLLSGARCTRTVGPYYDQKYLSEAVSRHIKAQHANTIPAMEETTKADARMARFDRPDAGYEAPSV